VSHSGLARDNIAATQVFRVRPRSEIEGGRQGPFVVAIAADGAEMVRQASNAKQICRPMTTGPELRARSRSRAIFIWDNRGFDTRRSAQSSRSRPIDLCGSKTPAACRRVGHRRRSTRRSWIAVAMPRGGFVRGHDALNIGRCRCVGLSSDLGDGSITHSLLRCRRFGARPDPAYTESARLPTRGMRIGRCQRNAGAPLVQLKLNGDPRTHGRASATHRRIGEACRT